MFGDNIALERKMLWNNIALERNGLQKQYELQKHNGLHFRHVAFKRNIPPKTSIMIFLSPTGHGVALEE